MDTDIVNATTPAPSFTSDVDGAYELELSVTDPGALSDTDTVIITAATPNVAPNADAGLDQNSDVLTLVTLNGSGTDPDNGPNPIIFQWTFAQVPLGSTLTDADITNATNAQASFTPDVTGLYRLTLTVSDGDLSDTDDVDINVTQANVLPNADAGADIVVQLGPPAETATLDGSASDDPDDFPNPTLTFQWTFVSTPPGSTLTNANITDANTAMPSFTPDVAGFYTLELVVFDGEDQDTDQVMVKANAAPVAVDDSFTTDEDVPLNVPAPGVLSNDTDANSDPLTAVLVSGQPPNAQSFTFNPDGSFNYTPNADFNGTDSFTYNANDGSVDSNVATVTITVTLVNDLPVAVDDAYSVNEDNPLIGTSVLGNDTDAENATLTAVLDTGPTNAQSFTLNTDGIFSYT
ncbi:MAG: Ig-like domain-containing protein, partial [Pseudonocardiaceae bacterium]